MCMCVHVQVQLHVGMCACMCVCTCYVCIMRVFEAHACGVCVHAHQTLRKPAHTLTVYEYV